MFYLPSARRFILPALIVLVVLILTQLFTQHKEQQDQHRPWSQTNLLHAALRRQIIRRVHILPGRNYTLSLSHGDDGIHPDSEQALWAAIYQIPSSPGRPLVEENSPQQEQHHQSQQHVFPAVHSRLLPFLTCDPNAINPHTSHLRLSAKIHNISMTPPSMSNSHKPDTRFFNPAIIPLPHWSASSLSSGDTPAGAKYALVSRLVTTGFHQESHICLADICLPPPGPPQQDANRSSNTTSSPKAASNVLLQTHGRVQHRTSRSSGPEVACGASRRRSRSTSRPHPPSTVTRPGWRSRTYLASTTRACFGAAKASR